MSELKKSSKKNKTFKASPPIYPYNIKCKAELDNEIYVDSHGIVLPCCWVGIQLRKMYPEYYINGDPTPIKKELKHNKGDNQKNNFINDFYDIIEDAGGIKAFSLDEHILSDILDNEFYMFTLKELWGKKSCKFCSNFCAANREQSEYSNRKSYAYNNS
jgi:hypothetical protein